MSLRVTWNHPALVTFYELAPHEAMAVDRAVIRFAQTREGEVTWHPPYFSLRIGAFRVRFAVDRVTGTMSVLYLYRVR